MYEIFLACVGAVCVIMISLAIFLWAWGYCTDKTSKLWDRWTRLHRTQVAYNIGSEMMMLSDWFSENPEVSTFMEIYGSALRDDSANVQVVRERWRSQLEVLKGSTENGG